MTHLRESGTLQAIKVSGHRYRARLIEGDRWGSSGYYDRDVLERDGPNVWPEGTPVYLDHPSVSEQMERPERSVRDLAGKITSTPAYDNDGLYAEVEFYPHTAPVIEALWADVGMSIRAAGTTESGERQGRRGPVITSLSEGLSVDVVTRAGAGGKLVAMLESARGNETNPAPAGEEISTEEKEHPMGDITLTEAAHADLVEKASRVDALETQLAEATDTSGGGNSGGGGRNATSELERLRAENKQLKAEIAQLKRQSRTSEAAKIISDTFAESGVTAPTVIADLTESVITADLDDAAITEKAKAYAAEFTPAGGVKNMGDTTPVHESDRQERTDEDTINALEGR